MPDEPLEAEQDSAPPGETQETGLFSKPVIAVLLALLILLPLTLYGVGFFDDEVKEEPEPDIYISPWTPTYYHYPGAVEAPGPNNETNLSGPNLPYWTNGTYYATGGETFEPTIGVTSSGSLFMTFWHGLGEGTHIFRSQDQGQTWEDIGPWDPNGNGGQVKNSNDPYLYVDTWTDRVVKFDMHALLGMTFEYSDNDGDTWSAPIPVTGESPQDHQTIASAPVPDGYIFESLTTYQTLFVYSINTGAQGGGVGGSYGETSNDGGRTWDYLGKAHYEIGKSPCSGLSGHLIGDNEGTFYRGQPSCEGPATYRSTDGGLTWTEHTIAQMTTQTHEVAIGTDEANNVHAFWIGDDNLPYYSNSQDMGETWREALMVAPPGITGTGFPTIAGGADGRAAFAYIGQSGNGSWSGYMGLLTDGFAEEPLITTVAVNNPKDPLDETEDCGYRRCGGFGDFIDIVIDLEGRPWAAMAHNPGDSIQEEGIVTTIAEGPALRGELRYLDPLPLGGHATLS